MIIMNKMQKEKKEKTEKKEKIEKIQTLIMKIQFKINFYQNKTKNYLLE